MPNFPAGGRHSAHLPWTVLAHPDAIPLPRQRCHSPAWCRHASCLSALVASLQSTARCIKACARALPHRQTTTFTVLGYHKMHMHHCAAAIQLQCGLAGTCTALSSAGQQQRSVNHTTLRWRCLTQKHCVKCSRVLPLHGRSAGRKRSQQQTAQYLNSTTQSSVCMGTLTAQAATTASNCLYKRSQTPITLGHLAHSADLIQCHQTTRQQSGHSTTS